VIRRPRVDLANLSHRPGTLAPLLAHGATAWPGRKIEKAIEPMEKTSKPVRCID
jgi:hypothetical protein